MLRASGERRIKKVAGWLNVFVDRFIGQLAVGFRRSPVIGAWRFRWRGTVAETS